MARLEEVSLHTMRKTCLILQGSACKDLQSVCGQQTESVLRVFMLSNTDLSKRVKESPSVLSLPC